MGTMNRKACNDRIPNIEIRRNNDESVPVGVA